MRYVLLIYASEEDVTRMTQAERDAVMRSHGAFAEDTQKRGLLTGGAPLQSTRTAKTVRVRKGKTFTTDGPFAETKEQLGGIYVLNCKDLDEAINLAARLPEVSHGTVEIRPVLEL